jgi:hypothetical protein
VKGRVASARLSRPSDGSRSFPAKGGGFRSPRFETPQLTVMPEVQMRLFCFLRAYSKLSVERSRFGGFHARN